MKKGLLLSVTLAVAVTLSTALSTTTTSISAFVPTTTTTTRQVAKRGFKTVSLLRKNMCQKATILFLNDNANDDDSDGGGDALAKEFYERLKKLRESEEELSTNDNDTADDNEENLTSLPDGTNEVKKIQNSKPFSYRREVSTEQDTTRDVISSEAGGSSYFGTYSNNEPERRRRTSSLFDERPTPTTNPYDSRNFGMLDLASSETTLKIQGLFAVGMLIAVLAVGFMGGIKTGEDYVEMYGSSHDDEFDSTILPVPNDGSAPQPFFRGDSNGDWKEDASVWI